MSAHHARRTLSGPRKRARKRALAARDGAWCTYCGRLFADLRQATLDHVVPLSLYRTWRAEDTVLACHPCNQAKADRIPLLLALLLLTQYAVTGVTPHVAPHPADPHPANPGVHEHPTPTGSEHRQSGVHDTVHRPTTPAFTPGVWPLLARLAAAYEAGARPPESADSTAGQSMPDQHGHGLVAAVNAVPDPAVNTRPAPAALTFTRLPVNVCEADPQPRPDTLRQAA